jgi:RimJ/RimL family protein N-acetyltransferase
VALVQVPLVAGCRVAYSLAHAGLTDAAAAADIARRAGHLAWPAGLRYYSWKVEYDGRCIGSAALDVNPEQHSAEYSVGLFVAALRGRGLGREITRLALAWAFDVLGVHRVELQALASNSRAIKCYLACGFRQEGVRREAELYPDGWKDFIMMGILRA